MRKIVVTGIIFILIMIVWIGYLKYDTKNFIEELSHEPLKQVDKAPKDTTETSKDKVAKTEQTGFENALSSLPEEKTEIDQENKHSDTNTENKDNVLQSVQTPEETGISPELKKVFSEYHNLYRKSEELSLVLAPLITRSVEQAQRLRTIGQDLSAAKDEETRRKIRSEWNAIDKWIEENKPDIIKLQDEATRLSNERLRIINAYGFATETDFLKAHSKDYETWVSDEGLSQLSIFRN